MIETLNQLLFAFTVLFGLKAPIYSNSVDVTIDTKNQQMNIYCSDLQTQKNFIEHTTYLQNALDSMNKLDSSFNGLQLIRNELIPENNRIDYQLVLTYQSAETIEKYFKIDLDSSHIFVHSNEIIVFNSGDSLNSTIFQGERLPFDKLVDGNYKFSYFWKVDSLYMDLVPLKQ